MNNEEEETFSRSAGRLGDVSYLFHSAQISTHGLQGIFFQTAYLSLADMDFLCYLRLCFALEKTKVNDMAFPFRKAVHSLVQADIFNPVFLGAFLITQLIHDVERIAAVCVDRFVETDGTLDCVQSVGYLLLADTDFFCNFAESWFL